MRFLDRCHDVVRKSGGSMSHAWRGRMSRTLRGRMSLYAFLRKTKPPLAFSFTVWLPPTGSRSACTETVYNVERETGLEPATACLEGRNSTTELLPHAITQIRCAYIFRSGCADLNRGPHGPKPCALPTAPHPANALYPSQTWVTLAPTDSYHHRTHAHYSTLLAMCQVLLAFSSTIAKF